MPAPMSQSDNEVLHRQGRYRVQVMQHAGREPRVVVKDGQTDAALLEWRGQLARHLLHTGALPESALRSAEYACDKPLIRHLTLVCTAAKLALDQIADLEAEADRPKAQPHLRTIRSAERLSPEEHLADRLQETGRHLPGPHMLVAETLFARRGEHFSESDVICLVSLECPSMRLSLIHGCLEELTAWKVIQRIVIDASNIFYDVDMRPHLHLYDPVTRTLSDAPRTGVVSLEASA